MVFFPFNFSKFDGQFLIGLFELRKLLFGLLEFLFNLKELIGDDKEFLLGLIESLGKLVTEIFEHDFVVFLHFLQLQ